VTLPSRGFSLKVRISFASSIESCVVAAFPSCAFTHLEQSVLTLHKEEHFWLFCMTQGLASEASRTRFLRYVFFTEAK
jgi:hypothetical protein